MNEEKAMELMRKLLQADRVIHEQQLGLGWAAPTVDVFRSVDPGYFHAGGESEFNTLEDLDSAFRQEEAAETKTIEAKDHQESLASKFKDTKGFSRSIKKMLELLCNEAGFLVCLIEEEYLIHMLIFKNK